MIANFKATLRAARVFAVGVALADTAVAAVDEQFDVVPSCEFSSGLPRLSLRLVQ